MLKEKIAFVSLAIVTIACLALSLYSYFHSPHGIEFKVYSALSATSFIGVVSLTFYKCLCQTPKEDEKDHSEVKPLPNKVIDLTGLNEQTGSYLFKIPNDLLTYVIKKLEYWQIAKLNKVCKKFYQFCHSSENISFIFKTLHPEINFASVHFQSHEIAWIVKDINDLEELSSDVIDFFGGAEKILSLPVVNFYADTFLERKDHPNLSFFLPKDLHSVPYFRDAETWQPVMKDHPVVRGMSKDGIFYFIVHFAESEASNLQKYLLLFRLSPGKETAQLTTSETISEQVFALRGTQLFQNGDKWKKFLEGHSIDLDDLVFKSVKNVKLTPMS